MKYIIGIIIGITSILIIIVRNIDIYVRSGWGVEVIPLQVCHIGSIIVGLALILKKKWLILVSFSFEYLILWSLYVLIKFIQLVHCLNVDIKNISCQSQLIIKNAFIFSYSVG